MSRWLATAASHGQQSPPRSIAILGGGLAGLTAAYYLSLHPVYSGAAREGRRPPITLIDSSTKRLGGWLESRRVIVEAGDGRKVSALLESGPRSIRPSGAAGAVMLDLVKRLGLENEMITVSKSSAGAQNRFIYYPDQLNRLPNSLASFAKSAFSSSVMKGVIGEIVREPFRARGSAKDESIKGFLSRRFGTNVANNLASAMVHGIYAGDHGQLSVRSTFKYLWDLEKEHGSVIKGLFLKGGQTKASGLDETIKKELFKSLGGLGEKVKDASVYSFKDGTTSLVDKLEKACRLAGNINIRLATHVTTIDRSSTEKVIVKTESGTVVADHLIAAIPSSRLGRLIELPPSLDLGYNPQVTVAVVNIIFPNPVAGKNGKFDSVLPVSGFGYLIPQTTPSQENPYKVLGCVFDSVGVPGQDFYTDSGQDATDSLTKVTMMVGGHAWSGLHDKSKEKLIEACLSTLKRHLKVDLPTPVYSHCSFQQDCIPQYTLGHHQRMLDLHKHLVEEEARSMSVIGSSYAGVSVNDIVRNAWEVVHGLGAGRRPTGLELIV